jgi:hypothetical protein
MHVPFDTALEMAYGIPAAGLAPGAARPAVDEIDDDFPCLPEGENGDSRQSTLVTREQSNFSSSFSACG